MARYNFAWEISLHRPKGSTLDLPYGEFYLTASHSNLQSAIEMVFRPIMGEHDRLVLKRVFVEIMRELWKPSEAQRHLDMNGTPVSDGAAAAWIEARESI